MKYYVYTILLCASASLFAMRQSPKPELHADKLSTDQAAFVQAVKEGNVALVEAMIRNKFIDPNALIDDYTPLQLAIMYHQKDVFMKLLACGARPDQEGHGRNTPLIDLACVRTAPEARNAMLAELVARRGSDALDKRVNGLTPLIVAIQNADPRREEEVELAMLLIELGADPNQVSGT